MLLVRLGLFYMWVNASIPQIECFVRSEYLYNLESHHGEFTPCTIYGVRSLPGSAIKWHLLDKEYGASVWNLPISAFVHDNEGEIKDLNSIPHYTVEMLELWDCFSYNLSITEFDHLSGRRCQVWLKNGKPELGNYLFTVDWHGNNYSELPGDGGHKCAHIIQLDCGLFAALPNNRMLFSDPANINVPWGSVPAYKTNTHTYQCEQVSKWSAGEGYFYPVVAGALDEEGKDA